MREKKPTTWRRVQKKVANAFQLKVLLLLYPCRDKLKIASDELQKKKAYIDSLEPKVSSSGK